MPTPTPAVAHIETLRGPQAQGDVPDLLIEVPHGADRRDHYDAFRAQLQGDLPDGLEDFFFVNTDVGAYQLGRWVAQAYIHRNPSRSVRVIRCLIPRTFIDTNRKPNERGGDLRAGAVTPGLQPYIHDKADQDWLRARHLEYTQIVEAAFAEVCGRGGLALIPHTYGPVSMGIERVDDDIVKSLHWALAPERADTWPVRPEVDLIHTDEDGTSLAPPDVVEALAAAYRADGLQVALGDTYFLHPSTMGCEWSSRYPGQVLTLEVRRDLLVERFEPFAEMTVDPQSLARFGVPLVEALCL